MTAKFYVDSGNNQESDENQYLDVSGSEETDLSDDLEIDTMKYDAEFLDRSFDPRSLDVPAFLRRRS